MIFGAVGGPKWDAVPYEARPEAGLPSGDIGSAHVGGLVDERALTRTASKHRRQQVLREGVCRREDLTRAVVLELSRIVTLRRAAVAYKTNPELFLFLEVCV